MELYNIVRSYYSYNYYRRYSRRIIRRNLTLEEAQAWCRNPETSSSTCTSAVGRRRTSRLGPWFDGYELAR